MKVSQINKLYRGLTPDEQAVLAFEALSRLDTDDIENIVSSVPREQYRCLHNDYQTKSIGLQNLVRLYGISYWKNRTLLMTALHATDDVGGYAQLAIRFASNIASMNSALIKVCQLVKADSDAVKIQADCLGEPTFDEYATADLVAQHIELLTLAVMTYRKIMI